MTNTELRLHMLITERDKQIAALYTSCNLLQKCLEEEQMRNKELEEEINMLKISEKQKRSSAS